MSGDGWAEVGVAELARVIGMSVEETEQAAAELVAAGWLMIAPASRPDALRFHLAVPDHLAPS